MKPEHVVPTILMGFNVMAGVVYFLSGDKMRAGYFISAAFITYFASF